MDFRKYGISSKTYHLMDENINRERDTRFRWNCKFARIEQDPSHGQYSWRMNFDRDYAEETAKSVENTFKPPQIKFLPRANLNKVDEKRIEKAVEQMDISSAEGYRLKVVDMFEQSAKEKTLLYSNLSRENNGRVNYLKVRNKHNPESKYRFPLTASMMYGWNMYDSNNNLIKRNEQDEMYNIAGNLNRNKYGIKDVLGREFYRPNGALVSYDKLPRAKFTS